MSPLREFSKKDSYKNNKEKKKKKDKDEDRERSETKVYCKYGKECDDIKFCPFNHLCRYKESCFSKNCRYIHEKSSKYNNKYADSDREEGEKHNKNKKRRIKTYKKRKSS